MGVALAKTVPFDQIAQFIRTEPVIFGNQAGRAQAFLFHEIAIGVSQAAGGHLPQAIMIIKEQRKLGFADQQRLALVAFDKRLGILAEARTRQRFKDMEHLFGVFLVLDQLTEMMERLQRAKAGSRTVRVDEGTVRITRRREVMLDFHTGHMSLTNIDVNIEYWLSYRRSLRYPAYRPNSGFEKASLARTLTNFARPWKREMEI